ncbi:phospholipase [Serratia sp. S1B]|nr:phospholipase [Serratia sp. S1B]
MRIFHKIHDKLQWSPRHYAGLLAGIFFIGYASSAVYHTVKPLPRGIDYTGALQHADVQFFADETYVDATGKVQQDQRIFNQMLSLVEQAKTTIVIDMFLFNDEMGEHAKPQRHLTQELTQALIRKRIQSPNIEIKVITDPINSVYGGLAPEHYRKLRQAGVDVIETNLTPLRTPNPVWSGFWYLCCQGAGNNPQAGWLPNPFGQGKVTLRSYFNLLNFKANHRKTIVVDTEQGWKGLVTSANPHDGSSHHDNVALLVSGPVAVDILNSEQPVAEMSQGDMGVVIIGQQEGAKNLPQVQVLTEAAIYRAALNMINTAKPQDHIDLAMFYLSERKIIDALKQAKRRGVQIRVLLDPNKDAFGLKKNGIPNREVAAELHDAGIQIRWNDTHGEQAHTKMLLKHNAMQSELLLGSANFTARNLKNYNLETDLRVIGATQTPVFVDAQRYFNTAWENLNGRQISVDYSKYADSSKLKYALYRFMEWSGLSTF